MYSANCHCFFAVKNSWKIVDNKPIINKFKTPNKKNNVQSIMVLDFFTICNKLIYEIIDFFHSGDIEEYDKVSKSETELVTLTKSFR